MDSPDAGSMHKDDPHYVLNLENMLYSSNPEGVEINMKTLLSVLQLRLYR